MANDARERGRGPRRKTDDAVEGVSHTTRVGGDGEKQESINYKRWRRADTRHRQLEEYLVVAATVMLCGCCARIAAPLRPTRDTERGEGQRDSRMDVGVSLFFLCASQWAPRCYPLLPCARSPWRPDITFQEGRREGAGIFHGCSPVAAFDTLIVSPPPSRHHHPHSLLPSLRACMSAFMLPRLPSPLLV